MIEGPFFVFYVCGDDEVEDYGVEEFATRKEVREYLDELYAEFDEVTVWIREGGINREEHEMED